jgi:predicted nucleic acid-binding Zn ribbon protein
MTQLQLTILKGGRSMEEIGKIIPLVFRKQVRHNEQRVMQILAPLWPQAAGKAMSRHSKPVAFNAGMLTLESDSSAWSAEMNAMTEKIQARVNKFLGESVVRKLRVRYVPNPATSDIPGKSGLREN